MTTLPEAFSAPTICGAFQSTATVHADAVALRTKGDATRLTWRDYAASIRRIAGGLAGHGLRRGDTVAILLVNRPEFNLVDTAAIHLGAIPFSIYVSSTADQIRYLLEDSGARVAVTERAFEAKLREAAAGTAVRTIVVVDGESSLDQLAASAPADFDFEAAWRAVMPDAILTIIYTSGTTGAPKGVELTHAK